MTVRERFGRIAVLLGVVCFGVLWYLSPTYSEDEMINTMLTSLIYRVLGSIVFLALACYLGMHLVGRLARGTWKVFLPALLVSLNNFPILALAWGEATITRQELLPLFLLDCLFIGIFEELAFRGVLFTAILEKRRATKRNIFLTTLISSVLFGLVHLANLIEGANIGATLLQIGYSTLIGGMCAIVFLKSGNILLPILLHTLFDIGGRMIDVLGEGRIWNLPTVIITAVLGVAVFVWMLYMLLQINPAETDRLYPKKDGDAEKNQEKSE